MLHKQLLDVKPAASRSTSAMPFVIEDDSDDEDNPEPPTLESPFDLRQKQEDEAKRQEQLAEKRRQLAESKRLREAARAKRLGIPAHQNDRGVPARLPPPPAKAVPVILLDPIPGREPTPRHESPHAASKRVGKHRDASKARQPKVKKKKDAPQPQTSDFHPLSKVELAEQQQQQREELDRIMKRAQEEKKQAERLRRQEQEKQDQEARLIREEERQRMERERECRRVQAEEQRRKEAQEKQFQEKLKRDGVQAAEHARKESERQKRIDEINAAERAKQEAERKKRVEDINAAEAKKRQERQKQALESKNERIRKQKERNSQLKVSGEHAADIDLTVQPDIEPTAQPAERRGPVSLNSTADIKIGGPMSLNSTAGSKAVQGLQQQVRAAEKTAPRKVGVSMPPPVKKGKQRSSEDFSGSQDLQQPPRFTKASQQPPRVNGELQQPPQVTGESQQSPQVTELQQPRPTTGAKQLSWEMFNLWRESHEDQAEANEADADTDTDTDDEGSSIDPNDSSDYVYSVWQVYRREYLVEDEEEGLKEDDISWLMCGDSHGDPDSANQAALMEMYKSYTTGTERFADPESGYTTSTKLVDGLAQHIVCNPRLGKLSIVVEPVLRTVRHGILPKSKKDWINFNQYLVFQRITSQKRQPASGEDAAKEVIKSETTFVAGTMTSYLPQANQRAIHHFARLTTPRQLNLTQESIARQKRVHELATALGDGELFNKAFTDARGRKFEVWVQAEANSGPRNHYT
jgi:hypothetical protein